MIDITSRAKDGPAKELSNFTERHFILNRVPCKSIEGVLQAFKSPTRLTQAELSGLVGYQAWKRGQELNSWQMTQVLHWNGVEYQRQSSAYAELLTRLYNAVYVQDPHFRNSLLDTVGQTLRHTTGHNDPRRTVLTEEEYIGQLDRLRWRALAEND